MPARVDAVRNIAAGEAGTFVEPLPIAARISAQKRSPVGMVSQWVEAPLGSGIVSICRRASSRPQMPISVRKLTLVMSQALASRVMPRASACAFSIKKSSVESSSFSRCSP